MKKILTPKQAREQAWQMSEELAAIAKHGEASETMLYAKADSFLKELMQQGSIDVALSTVRTWLVDYELAIDDSKLPSSEKFLQLSAVRILQSLPPSPMPINSYGRKPITP